MSKDTIYRQEAIEAIKRYESAYSYDLNNGLILAMNAVADVPTIEERKKGKWIKNDNGTYSCSLCQSWIPKEQYHYARFCLYCGADMRGGNRNDITRYPL